MGLVKTCITWNIWRENPVVTRSKFGVVVVYLKILVMLNDLRLVRIAKVTQEQPKCRLFLELK